MSESERQRRGRDGGGLEGGDAGAVAGAGGQRPDKRRGEEEEGFKAHGAGWGVGGRGGEIEDEGCI